MRFEDRGVGRCEKYMKLTKFAGGYKILIDELEFDKSY